MTTLAPDVEEILEKLLRIAHGDPELVQEALGRASPDPGRAPTLEQVVLYIVENRRQVDRAQG